jgi:ubiquitin-protein ligase
VHTGRKYPSMSSFGSDWKVGPGYGNGIIPTSNIGGSGLLPPAGGGGGSLSTGAQSGFSMGGEEERKKWYSVAIIKCEECTHARFVGCYCLNNDALDMNDARFAHLSVGETNGTKAPGTAKLKPPVQLRRACSAEDVMSLCTIPTLTNTNRPNACHLQCATGRCSTLHAMDTPCKYCREKKRLTLIRTVVQFGEFEYAVSRFGFGETIHHTLVVCDTCSAVGFPVSTSTGFLAVVDPEISGSNHDESDGVSLLTQGGRIHPGSANPGDHYRFCPVTSYAYPPKCVHGAVVTFNKSNKSTPPAHVTWNDTGETFWVYWEDLCYLGSLSTHYGTCEKKSTSVVHVKLHIEDMHRALKSFKQSMHMELAWSEVESQMAKRLSSKLRWGSLYRQLQENGTSVDETRIVVTLTNVLNLLLSVKYETRALYIFDLDNILVEKKKMSETLTFESLKYSILEQVKVIKHHVGDRWHESHKQLLGQILRVLKTLSAEDHLTGGIPFCDKESTDHHSSKCMGRMNKELIEFQKNPIPGITVKTTDEVNVLDLFIKGPSSSPYEGGVFRFSLRFPRGYPFSPPIVCCMTQIFHCNMDLGILICHESLSANWSPVMHFTHMILQIQCLFQEPDVDCADNSEAADLYISNREEYNRRAATSTKLHAKVT